MRFSLFALAAAAACVSAQEASAYGASASDDCQGAYNTCLSSGADETKCQCDFATCEGQDNARTREFCASALASLSSSAATPSATATDDCQSAYNTCLSSGAGETKCQCDLATCAGQDNARTREFCASALASLSSAPAARTSAPPTYACNPAHAYPNQQSCISQSGTLTLVGPTATGKIITGTAGSQPAGQTPITAPENSIPLGGVCSDDRQCVGDSTCYASNAGLIRSCGNFNAACKADNDCAYNTCNNGLCNGFLPSASFLANSPSSTAAAVPTAPVVGGGSFSTITGGVAAPTGNGSFTGTTPTPYTGAAASVGYGFAAVLFGFAAWIL